MIRHEIGHALNLRGLSDADAEALRSSPTLRRRAAELGAAVSRKATESAAEFVAEVYAGIAAGKSYGPDVMAAYNQWGGPTP